MMASRQKVSAVLRKAGLVAAKWHASARVKGWGNWSQGYQVKTRYDGVLTVEWTPGSYTRRGYDTAEQFDAAALPHLERARDALIAAGVEARIEPRVEHREPYVAVA